jgi:hypothetical protein
MGRSILPVAQGPAPPEGVQQHNPFDALGTQFRVAHEGSHVQHRRIQLNRASQPAAEQTWEVHYIVGSGNRGHSYLTDCDGYLFQTPISWYSLAQVWNLSPGFGTPEVTGRPVVPDCLFCHANRANAVEGSVNRYTAPLFGGSTIGCQRCHGPGELHLAGPGEGKGADGIDPTIVNPRHLAPDLRDAVCEQCHLQAAARTLIRGRGLYDYRPGLPFESFWSVFVRAPGTGEDQKAVGQVEQMQESRCFQGSGGPGRLGCISCHNPHECVPPAQRVAYYRGRCLQCHERQGCSLPAAERLRHSAEDSCIDCHMPRYGASDIPHTAVANHRIPRGSPASRGPRSSRDDNARRTSDAGPMPLVSFYGVRKGMDQEQDNRNRAVALVRLALGKDLASIRAVPYALPALVEAVRRDPEDQVAREARGYALRLLGRAGEGLAEFEAVLAQAPHREPALVGAALLAEELGQAKAARDYWQRAVAANPWSPSYRRSLVQLLVKKEAWPEAQPHCQAWVRLDPFSTEACVARVQCLLAAGDKAAARAEFARLEALAPPNIRELQIRYGKRLR